MNTKKWIAVSAAICTLIGSGAVLAEENVPAQAEDMIIEVPSNNPDIMLINEPASAEDGIIEVPSNDENIMLINEEPAAAMPGTVFGVTAKEGMYPIRQIAEGLGYTVNWIGETRTVEIIRGAQYITMTIGEDVYTFSRRAPEALGAAPVIIEDRTYVPQAFLENYLQAFPTAAYEDGSCDIVQASVVTVTAIDENGSLTVEDAVRGEVVVHIGEETEILAGGEAADAAQIEVGMTISVLYGDAMTMSLPPQTTAKKIILA